MEQWNLVVPTHLLRWTQTGCRCISINSFGFGGTNAHCILDDAFHFMKAYSLSGNNNVHDIDGPYLLNSFDSAVDLSSNRAENVSQSSRTSSLDSWRSTTPQRPTGPKLFVWTSNEEAGIGRCAKLYAAYLAAKIASGLSQAEKETLLTRFAGTLAARRSILPWRSFLVATSCEEVIDKIENVPIKPIRASNVKTVPMVAFVFTGQGAQWFAMGRELYAQPIFRDSLKASDSYFASIGSCWSLTTEMFRDERLSQLELPDLG